MAAERRLELRDIGHHEAKLGALLGELALQVEKVGARNMAGREGLVAGHREIGDAAALGRRFEIGRAVEQPQIGPIEDAGKFHCADQLRHPHLPLIWTMLEHDPEVWEPKTSC